MSKKSTLTFQWTFVSGICKTRLKNKKLNSKRSIDKRSPNLSVVIETYKTNFIIKSKVNNFNNEITKSIGIDIISTKSTKV
jgi:hypothetical protein